MVWYPPQVYFTNFSLETIKYNTSSGFYISSNQSEAPRSSSLNTKTSSAIGHCNMSWNVGTLRRLYPGFWFTGDVSNTGQIGYRCWQTEWWRNCPHVRLWRRLPCRHPVSLAEAQTPRLVPFRRALFFHGRQGQYFLLMWLCNCMELSPS